MIFSSAQFIFLFMPAAWVLFAATRRLAGARATLAMLSFVSLVFYSIWIPGGGKWTPLYLCLLLGSVGFNFAVARLLGPGRRWSGAALAAGIAGNLGLLFWFKYAAFATGQLKAAGVLPWALAPQVLPLAISFFTFQQIAYIVDVSRGTSGRAPLLKQLLMVSFFPHLIAGPITHPATILPQLDDPRPTWAMSSMGLFIFAVGLAKKSVLADPLGVYANIGFANPGALATANAWATVLCYTFQLYFDFSGYSDMAVGLGLLLGVRLPWNFLSPYKSGSISEFWRRWHVTLSDFLKNYLYIPLGGSRNGKARTALNLLVTMLLGGIWHGAGWTFVLWGLLHGSALVVNHLFKPLGWKVPRIAGWLMTALVVVMGWVLFRAPTIEAAGTMYARMFRHKAKWITHGDEALYTVLPYLVGALAVGLAGPSTRELAGRFEARPRRWALWGAVMFALAMVYVLGQVKAPEFLYFDF